MKKAIVLLSGGIDSSTVLYIARKKGYKTLALIFDYGQRHKREIESAKKVARSVKSPYKVIRLEFPRNLSSLLDKKKSLPSKRTPRVISKKGIPSTYVPARNLVFLSVAASFAESEGKDAIFIGAHTHDYSGYPDCRKDFFLSFKKTLSKGTKKGKKIKVVTPFINRDKKYIIKKAFFLGVPIHLTWSCYKGGRVPCGVCDSCIFRKKAFRELNIIDPVTVL